MKISHGTRMKGWHGQNGYGYATDQMLRSLDNLGYETTRNDPTADVEIWFDQPHHWNFSEGLYRIGYHPWESTDMRDDWKKTMNECDEVWTPSPLIAQWYKNLGIKRPVYVYEHGVDSETWYPKRRKVKDTLNFLHVGAEAARKGGDIVLDAFKIAFPTQRDVSLTLKMNNPGWNVPQIGRIRIIPNMMSIEDLVELYHEQHVFVYPSWGEGFGLNPLQAMATGMPTLVTGEWAPYAWAVPDDFKIESDLVQSPWPDIHQGEMFKPRLDDVVDKMRWIYDNFHYASDQAYERAPGITRYYDWNELTYDAFESLEERISKI